LLTFYKVYRAFVRGKVISFQIDDDSISDKKKEEALKTAGKYFDLALSYTSP
jgi:aminoglycoside phosphotransferase family enzyme